MNPQLLSLAAGTLAFATIFGGVAWWAHRRAQAQNDAIAALAQARGWRFATGQGHVRWRLHRELNGTSADIVAVSPPSRQGMGQGAPHFTRATVTTQAPGALLLTPQVPWPALPQAIDPMAALVGPAYGALMALPLQPLPPPLDDGRVLRADRDDRLQRALPGPALALLQAWPPSTAVPMPIVTLHQGSLQLTRIGPVPTTAAGLGPLLDLIEAALAPAPAAL